MPKSLEATLAHLSLVLIAMLIAVAIAVPLGMLVVHRTTLRNFVLGLASIFQTIPSLALFGFLIPIPFIGGIGRRTAIFALVLYALLPFCEIHTLALPASIPPCCRPPKPWA